MVRKECSFCFEGGWMCHLFSDYQYNAKKSDVKRSNFLLSFSSICRSTFKCECERVYVDL